ncbi:hypothetical protein TWF225_008687 [Orbilia oligospora]|nr:hypothetical protein TWF225_008687 [Orbilia oligospora]
MFNTASQGVATGAAYRTTQVVGSSRHEIDRYAERRGLGRLSGVTGSLESIKHFSLLQSIEDWRKSPALKDPEQKWLELWGMLILQHAESAKYPSIHLILHPDSPELGALMDNLSFQRAKHRVELDLAISLIPDYDELIDSPLIDLLKPLDSPLRIDGQEGNSFNILDGPPTT